MPDRTRSPALWIAIVSLLAGAAGGLLLRELNAINARLDRVTAYVLDHGG